MQPEYPALLDAVNLYWPPVMSQHGMTKEELAYQVTFEAGEMPRRDNINHGIGHMEALQLIAGVYNHHALKVVAPNAALKMFTIQMAYGPRVTLQMERIIEVLTRDPNTRQAVVFIGKPEDGPTGHQPCTTQIQFLIREGYTHAVVSMRSWDLVFGLPYDGQMFGALCQVVARCTGTLAGNVTVTAGSAHVYERHFGIQAKISNRRFQLADAVPLNFSAIREMAQDHVYYAGQEPYWHKADGMKHMVPSMFTEVGLG